MVGHMTQCAQCQVLRNSQPSLPEAVNMWPKHPLFAKCSSKDLPRFSRDLINQTLDKMEGHRTLHVISDVCMEFVTPASYIVEIKMIVTRNPKLSIFAFFVILLTLNKIVVCANTSVYNSITMTKGRNSSQKPGRNAKYKQTWCYNDYAWCKQVVLILPWLPFPTT